MKNFKHKNYTALICLGLAAATPAMAQTDQKTNPQDAPSSKALEDAIRKMDEALKGVTYTGNPDVDFVAKMIPHHQGAIDMAKVQLQYGKNPRVRRLAQIIIRSRNNQILKMRDWLRKNAGPANKNAGSAK